MNGPTPSRLAGLVPNRWSAGPTWRRWRERALTPLAADHPISRAFTGRTPGERRWGQSVSIEHQFQGRDGQEERFFLTCNPLIVPSGSLLRRAPGLFDMSRWSRIIEAADAFAPRRIGRNLLTLIVEQARRLPFPRVRLYELVFGEKRLYGRAATGFIFSAPADAHFHACRTSPRDAGNFFVISHLAGAAEKWP